MRKRLLLAILGVCGPLLLVIIVCYAVCAPTSLCFFVDRWVSSPDYSPDGERIAFECHYPTLPQALKDMPDDLGQSSFLLQWGYIPRATEICTVHTDGSHSVRLTYDKATDGFPAWSPDGQVIAYVSDPPYEPGSATSQAVFTIREDGSRIKRVSTGVDARWEKPAWSPDGKMLVFPAQDPSRHELGINLYAADLESGNVRALSALPGDELGVRWSPDQARLAFTWFPEGKGFRPESAAIRIIDAEGRNDAVVEHFANIGGLTWSPDGRRLAFWGSRSADCPDDDCTELYVLNLSSGSVECLTEQYELRWIEDTVWSPDGEQIAFTARAPGGRAIHTMTPDGGGLSQITSPAVHAGRDLVWAPDGKSIVFVRGVEGEKWHIWSVEVESGKLTRLKTP